MLQLSQKKYRCNLLNFFNFERLQQWTTAEISNSRNDKKLSQSIQDIKLIEKRKFQWEQVHKNHVSFTSKKLQSMRRTVTVTLTKWCFFFFHLRRQRVIVFQSSSRFFKNEQTTSITHSMQISEKLSSELIFLVVTKCLSELHLSIAQKKLFNDNMMMSLLDRTMTESHRLSEFISSFQKWTDYVNHTFNANQRRASSITHSMQINEKLSSELVFLVVTECLSELHLSIAQEKLLNDSMMMSLLDRTMIESRKSKLQSFLMIWRSMWAFMISETTHDFWSNFNKKSNIITIDIFENLFESRTEKTKIRFRCAIRVCFTHDQWIVTDVYINSSRVTSS